MTPPPAQKLPLDCVLHQFFFVNVTRFRCLLPLPPTSPLSLLVLLQLKRTALDTLRDKYRAQVPETVTLSLKPQTLDTLRD